MRAVPVFLLLSIMVVIGCSKSPFAGFKEVAPDIHFKLHVLGDTEREPTDSDSVFVRLRMAKLGDTPGSLYSSERWFAHFEDAIPDPARPAIKLHEGDSASVIAYGRSFPWATIGTAQKPALDTVYVRLEISLLSVRSKAVSRRIAHDLFMARTASDEASILAHFFTNSAEQWKEFMGVRYILDPDNHKGPVIQSGQLVSMHYSANFMDSGQCFDDTHRGGSPLTFRLGDPGQVIKGLEIAAHVLPNGGKGRFVIPSELAFGAKGSSSGIVPPFTPVIYTIEAWAAPEDVATPDTVAAR